MSATPHHPSPLSRWVALVRPKAALLVVMLPVGGFGYGLWERGSTISLAAVAPSLGKIAVVWLLGHAGAMWLNAVLDRDEGGVLLGRPVAVPRYTAPLGYASLALSATAAFFWFGWLVGTLVLLCALLSILYSHPRIALKGHPAGGPLVNGVGYGSISPTAGWLIALPVFSYRSVFTLIAIAFFVLGLYFAAQVFQFDEDRKRGYRTFVALHGGIQTLRLARLCFALPVFTLLTLSLIGLYPRSLWLSAPFFVWADRVFDSWRDHVEDPAYAGRLVQRLFITGLVLIASAYAHHIPLISQGRPGGGMGTAVVPKVVQLPRSWSERGQRPSESSGGARPR